MGFILYQPVVTGAPKEDSMVLKKLWRGDQANRGALCGAGLWAKAVKNDKVRLCPLAPGSAEMRPLQPVKLEPKSGWGAGNQCSGPLGLPLFFAICICLLSGGHHILIRPSGLPSAAHHSSWGQQHRGQDSCCWHQYRTWRPEAK